MKFFNQRKIKPRTIKILETCILAARVGTCFFKRLLTRGDDSHLLIIDGFLTGDTILLRPLINALLNKYGHSHKVSLLAGPHARYVLSDMASQIELIEYQFPWAVYDYSFRNLFRLCRVWLSLFARYVDIAVETRGDFRSIAWASLLCPDHLTGFDFTGGGHLLTTVVPDDGTVVHLFEHVKRIGQAMGVRVVEEDIAMSARRERCPSGKIGISFAGSQPLRSLPLQKRRELLDRLVEEKQIELWYIVAPQETASDLDAIRNTYGDRIRYFQGSFAEYYQFMQTLDAYIGMDSAGGHLCSIFGIPAAIIFGTQESWYTKPIGNRNLLCVEPERVLPCRPCDGVVCKRLEYQECLNHVVIEPVLDFIRGKIHVTVR